MAVWGALTNGNTDTNFDANGLAIVGGGSVFPVAATVTAMSFYGRRLIGGGTQYRYALYQGGTSDTDPTGATLVSVSESGIIDGSAIATGADAWISHTGLSLTVANSRLWLVLKSDVAIRMYTALSADLGDLPLGFGYFTGTTSGMNASTITDALPASVTAAYTSGGGSSNVKWNVTYTAAGTAGSAGGQSSATAQAATYVVNPNIVVAPRRNVFVNDQIIQY